MAASKNLGYLTNITTIIKYCKVYEIKKSGQHLFSVRLCVFMCKDSSLSISFVLFYLVFSKNSSLWKVFFLFLKPVRLCATHKHITVVWTLEFVFSLFSNVISLKSWSEFKPCQFQSELAGATWKVGSSRVNWRELLGSFFSTMFPAMMRQGSSLEVRQELGEAGERKPVRRWKKCLIETFFSLFYRFLCR